MFPAVSRGSLVIVSCPSCGTRYRVDPAPGDNRALCSSCGGVVPMVSAPRPYVLVPAAAGVARSHTPATLSSAAEPAPGRPKAAPPYDPWVESSAASVAATVVVPRTAGDARVRSGSPLLPALLAVVGALLGYWAGTKGLLDGLPLVSLAGSAGLAVLGASVGLIAGWAADRWTAAR
jgi:hypothetical protein